MCKKKLNGERGGGGLLCTLNHSPKCRYDVESSGREAMVTSCRSTVVLHLLT